MSSLSTGAAFGVSSYVSFATWSHYTLELTLDSLIVRVVVLLRVLVRPFTLYMYVRARVFVHVCVFTVNVIENIRLVCLECGPILCILCV